MESLLFALGWWVAGFFSFVIVLHVRFRRNADYDDSNITNTVKMVWVMTMRRIMLSKLELPDGSRPLDFVSHDETKNTGI